MLIMENGLKGLLNHCWCCGELCNVMKMVIPSLFLWTCHYIVLRQGCDKFMCIEKEWEIKRMYHFEGHFALRDEYYILRNVSHAAMETIFREKYGASQCLLLSRVVSHASIDACKDMSPMCPGLRNSGCVSLGHTCIIILDIVFHCIAHTYH